MATPFGPSTDYCTVHNRLFDRREAPCCQKCMEATTQATRHRAGIRQSEPPSMSYCHRHNVEYAPTEPCHVCATPVEERFPGIAAWLPRCSKHGISHGPSGCGACALEPKPTTPIYTIPARDVVSGMLYGACDPVLRVNRTGGLVEMVVERRDDMGDRYECLTGYGAETMVRVTLPGPSPRELCCTCQKPDDTYRALLIACEPPHRHEPSCPVAPVEGLHGGMRLWPAPWRGASGEASNGGWRSKYAGWVDAGVIQDLEQIGPAERDCIVMAFYHPPAPPAEKPQGYGWDPYPGALIDLAGRYG